MNYSGHSRVRASAKPADLLLSHKSYIYIYGSISAFIIDDRSGDSVVRTPENNDLEVSRQDENFNGSDDAKDGPSPGKIEQRHSDVADCVDDNRSQHLASDSTIDRHENSFDK